MSPTGKLIAGLAATGALTWLWLGPFGQAGAIANDLQSRVEQALAAEEAEAVDVGVPRRPVSRTVHLAGDFPDAVKRRMLEVASAQRGVAGAVWDEPPAPEAAASETASATPAEMQACGQRLTAAIGEEAIQFRSGSPYINPAGRRLIARIAEAARGCEGVRISIVGHSDAGGSESVNREMSAYRATAVRDALVEAGVPQAMLRTEGRGSAEPAAGNRADPANRRVEFTISVMGAG